MLLVGMGTIKNGMVFREYDKKKKERKGRWSERV